MAGGECAVRRDLADDLRATRQPAAGAGESRGLSTAPMGRDRRPGRERRIARAREHHEYGGGIPALSTAAGDARGSFWKSHRNARLRRGRISGQAEREAAWAGRARRRDRQHIGPRYERRGVRNRRLSARRGPPDCVRKRCGTAYEVTRVKIGPYELP